MAETFHCPHCDHEYPRSPRLVDRPVRCRNCQMSFKLRPDGEVEKVHITQRLEKTGRFRNQAPTVSSVLRAVNPADTPDPRARTVTDDVAIVERDSMDLDEEGIDGSGRGRNRRKRGRVEPKAKPSDKAPAPEAPAPEAPAPEAPAPEAPTTGSADTTVSAAAAEVERRRVETIRVSVARGTKIEDTLACPHCGHAYPRSPRLIDKPVRCRACRENFVVRKDWVVEKLRVSQRFTKADTVPPAAPVTEAAPESPVQVPPEEPVHERQRVETIRTAAIAPALATGDTLACPHCGENYPRNPKLIDRPVRCRSCRKGFIVRAGWLIESVQVSQRFEKSDAASEPPDRETKNRDLAEKMRQALAATQQQASSAVGGPAMAPAAGDRRIKRTSATSVGRISVEPEPAAPVTEPDVDVTTGPATFRCPHCQAAFPFRQDRVDQKTCCTSCNGGFILRADGSVDAGPAAPQPTVQSVETKDKVEAPVTANAAARSSSDAASRSSARRSTSLKGLSARQQAMREEMSRRLQERVAQVDQQDVASGAAGVAASSDQTERPGTDSKRKQPGSSEIRRKKKEDYEFSDAVLSGEGVHAGRELWFFKLVLVVILLPLILSWLLSLDFSDERKALTAYARPAKNKLAWEWPGRDATLRQRAWVYDSAMALPAGLERVKLDERRTIDLTVLGDTLRGQDLLPGTYLLLKRDALDHAKEVVAASKAVYESQIIKALETAEIGFTPLADLVSLLRGKGMGEKDATIVAYLVKGPNNPDGDCEILHAILKLGAPAAIEIVLFHHENTSVLQDKDSRYEYAPARLRGMLMRFRDPDWVARTGRVAQTTDSQTAAPVTTAAASQREEPLPWDGWRVLNVQAAPRGKAFAESALY